MSYLTFRRFSLINPLKASENIFCPVLSSVRRNIALFFRRFPGFALFGFLVRATALDDDKRWERQRVKTDEELGSIVSHVCIGAHVLEFSPV
jgi:hypothetical protein